MDYIYDYLTFLLKIITVLFGFIILLAASFSIKKKSSEELSMECLNEKNTQDILRIMKKFKWKQTQKNKKIEIKHFPKAYVLDFIGDMKASQLAQLRDEITLILAIAKTGDEVMVRIQSPGGSVTGYGLAAAQLERLRRQSIYLNVCIDQIAASGGYLMACIANKVYAAPFAIVGSIGVIAQLPNLHKWLKKHNIDFEQITAGKYKRTLTVFGENTSEGREKFSHDLELIHENFKNLIHQYRPQVEIDKVATGEYWLAQDAMPLQLVDEIKTSDDWIFERMQQFQIIHLKKQKNTPITEKLLKPISQLIERITGGSL